MTSLERLTNALQEKNKKISKNQIEDVENFLTDFVEKLSTPHVTSDSVAVASLRSEGEPKGIVLLCNHKPVLEYIYEANFVTFKGNKVDFPSDNVKNTFTECCKEIEKLAKGLSNNDEDALYDLFTKVVNTIKDLDGPKFDDFHAAWFEDLTMVKSNDEIILTIEERDDFVRVGLTSNPLEARTYKDCKVRDFALKIVKLIRENVENDLRGSENSMRRLKNLISNVPAEKVLELFKLLNNL